MASVDGKQLKQEFATLHAERATWNNMYQVLGEYVSQFKQNFDVEYTPGEFLIDDIYDSTGNFAAFNASSALLGMLWPGSAKKAIEITQPDDMAMTTELSEFYARINSQAITALDDPRANLTLSLDEYMIDQLIFGTSGVGVEAGDKSELLFKPYGVKELYIEEGRNGITDRLYIMYEWRLERVVAEYGVENLSEKLQKAYKDGKSTEKVKLLRVIKPRKEKKAEKGALSMPYMSVHMEYDSLHIIKEGGFEEQPIFVSRFRKLNYERYGRSPAVSALPDIREANVLREAVIVATEKLLDPPLGLLSDSMLGGGTLDTSAGALNVFNMGHNVSNRQPVFEINTIKDIRFAKERLAELEQSISQHFFIDRLLDFNNQAEMTLGEVQIRDQIRTQSLSALFSRQLSEMFTPLLERAVNMLWRSGKFGVTKGSEQEKQLLKERIEPVYFPDEIAERLKSGLDIYKVTYKTKAASAQDAEDYLAIIEMLGQYRQDIQISQGVKNRVDVGMAYKHMGMIRGVPNGIIREDDAVAELDKQDAALQQQQMALAAGVEAAGAMKDVAQAEQAARPSE